MKKHKPNAKCRYIQPDGRSTGIFQILPPEHKILNTSLADFKTTLEYHPELTAEQLLSALDYEKATRNRAGAKTLLARAIRRKQAGSPK